MNLEQLAWRRHLSSKHGEPKLFFTKEYNLGGNAIRSDFIMVLALDCRLKNDVLLLEWWGWCWRILVAHNKASCIFFLWWNPENWFCCSFQITRSIGLELGLWMYLGYPVPGAGFVTVQKTSGICTNLIAMTINISKTKRICHSISEIIRNRKIGRHPCKRCWKVGFTLRWRPCCENLINIASIFTWNFHW